MLVNEKQEGERVELDWLVLGKKIRSGKATLLRIISGKLAVFTTKLIYRWQC